jgi:hypothetical protein
MTIEHLSYSSISLYQSCPASWKFKYIDNLPTFSNPNLVFGTTLHNTVERYIQGQGKLVDLWQDNWQKAIKEERSPIVWGVDTPEAICNDGIRMISNPDIIKAIDQLKELHGGGENRIERKVELRVPGVPIPIVGYIDYIARDSIPGDFKTSSKSWTDERAQGESQPLFYLAALNQLGETVPGWKFRHFVFVKTKTPKFQTFESIHTPAECFSLFQTIQKVWKAIQANVFPENTTGWKCDPRYCDFYSKCRGK